MRGRYRAAFDALTREKGYGRMMVNAKITAPCDDNHSDDQEAFLPLYEYAMAHRQLGRTLDVHYNATLDRFCRITRPESASLYLAMCAAIRGEAADPALLSTLRQWPLELIQWTVNNTGRLDVWQAPSYSRFGDGESTQALAERNSGRLVWNADPYQLVGGNGGMGEQDPSAWLLAYWLARHHGLLAAPAAGH